MRRFRPPWTIEEHNEACFIVKDATDQALAYFYFEEEPGRRSVMGCFSSEAAPSRMTQAALEQLFAPLAGAVEILSIAKHGPGPSSVTWKLPVTRSRVPTHSPDFE